ncbi:MAG TPA: hypothetical protein VM097_12050 [Mycobacteriales bacterium]|nr:hypothetical protein [Mycobacteriales bacterium]
MEHVVFFPAHDGSPAFRRLASLEDAVRFVEHLRNTEGVDRVSVHALTEVPLAFKAYYKVEMTAGPEAVGVSEATQEALQADAPEVVVPVVVPAQEQPVVEEATPAPSSLGFFAR